MHHLSPTFRRKGISLYRSSGCQALVRFFALLRIKPHAPPLVRAPVNSFEFQSCDRTPRWSAYCVCCGTEGSLPTLSTHRLRRGLPGYLILFAPHAFVPQRQFPVQKAAFATGVLPNIYAFHRYTRNSAFLSCSLA